MMSKVKADSKDKAITAIHQLTQKVRQPESCCNG
jgi:hypothetical protein